MILLEQSCFWAVAVDGTDVGVINNRVSWGIIAFLIVKSAAQLLSLEDRGAKIWAKVQNSNYRIEGKSRIFGDFCLHDCLLDLSAALTSEFLNSFVALSIHKLKTHLNVEFIFKDYLNLIRAVGHIFFFTIKHWSTT